MLVVVVVINKGMVGVPLPDQDLGLCFAKPRPSNITSSIPNALALSLSLSLSLALALSPSPAHHSFTMATAPISKNHVAPPSAAGTPAAAATAEKGAMAYYEKVRKELREMIQRKRVLDKNFVCASLDLSFHDIGQ